MLEAFPVLNLKKKKKMLLKCWRRDKKEELGTRLDFPSILAETLRNNDFNCLVELLLSKFFEVIPALCNMV